MENRSFSSLGKIRAIDALYEGCGFPRGERLSFPADDCTVHTAQALLLEGIDFNLEYFPLKHLGYKSAIVVTGMLYAQRAVPQSLGVRLGISSKLDFEQIRELWTGLVTAAKEHGFTQVDLDLAPSLNGLAISLCATGYRGRLAERLDPKPRSKDLVCVSGALGAAYLGQQALERKMKELEPYRMIVGSYLKPELEAGIPERLGPGHVAPSAGYFVFRGLSDALKRLCRETGLGVKVYAEKIPFEGNSFELGKKLNIDPVSAAFNGGDDCRLLFTIPILQLEEFRKEFPTFDVIGHLAQPEVGATLVLPTGAELPVTAQGWPEEEPQTSDN
ncbi:MAG: hypothetical protein IJV01_01245 [Bacteroidales bacterium]|nr:hypothetical protein [Bacteroidales bacterium]